MRGFEVSSFFAIFALVLCLTTSDAAQDNEDDVVLMKNISTLHFQLFTSIQKKTKLIKVKKKDKNFGEALFDIEFFNWSVTFQLLF